jgi:hypothetical protein
LLQKQGKNLAASHYRKKRSKVTETVGTGKNKKKVEVEKLSYFKPWVSKNDIMTPDERGFANKLNEAFEEIGNIIDSQDDGPSLNAKVANVVMDHAWRITDSFNSTLKKRKGDVRREAIHKKPDDQKDSKITQSEWKAALEEVHKNTHRDVSEEIVDEYNLNPAGDESVSKRHIIRYLTQVAEVTRVEFEDLAINWEIFNAGMADPSAYHSKLVAELKDLAASKMRPSPRRKRVDHAGVPTTGTPSSVERNLTSATAVESDSAF